MRIPIRECAAKAYATTTKIPIDARRARRTRRARTSMYKPGCEIERATTLERLERRTGSKESSARISDGQRRASVVGSTRVHDERSFRIGV